MTKLIPPINFKCPYKHNCPHLEGLSSQYIWHERENNEDRDCDKNQLIAILEDEAKKYKQEIASLQKQNDELNAQLKVLHGRQFKKKKKDKEEDKKETVKPVKKRGAPVGHPGWFRKIPEIIDETIDVDMPEICPYCKSDRIMPIDETVDHIQEDILLIPKTVVTRYVHKQGICEKCKKKIVKRGENELINSHIGPIAKTMAVFLRYRLGLPYRKIQLLFKEMFNLDFVPASALGFDKRAASKGKSIYEDLKAKIKMSDCIHADETFWREDGKNAYVWFAGNEDLSLFHIDPSRSGQVARDIIGETFGGKLITDAYAAYDTIKCYARQTCLAHIIRTAKDVLVELKLLKGDSRNLKAEKFCEKIIPFFSEACKEQHNFDRNKSQRSQVKDNLVKKLNSICRTKTEYRKSENLRLRLIGKGKDQLFTFITHPDTPPTNNHAEQCLRHIVILRKICFGTRSAMGSLTHSILSSLIFTAHKQGVNTREFLLSLFTKDAKTAQKKLYLNTA